MFQINKNGGTASAQYYGSTTSSGGQYGSFGPSQSVGARIKITYDPYTDPNVILTERDEAGDGTFELTSSALVGGSYTGSAWTSTGKSGGPRSR